MNKKKDHVYVWPIYTRIIHWLIALSFTFSFIFSLQENLLNLHVGIGIIFGLMLLYRILWGFIGPRYAKFFTFKLSLVELKYYFVQKVQNRFREIPPGHNPASSWFTIIVVSLGTLISITGLLLYGIQEGNGVLGFLNNHYYKYMFILLDIHTYSSYILLAWAIIHVLGVLTEQFYHKTNMVFAMITGYKKAKGEDSKTGTIKRGLTYVFLFVCTMVFFVSIYDRNNIFVANKHEPLLYERDNPIYFKECGACHNPYPPFMLPSSSWQKIQRGLKNHFGRKITELEKKDDNKISLQNQKLIFEYLKANSANNSTREISIKVINSSNAQSGRISFSKTRYWRDTHKNIKHSVFKSDKIKTKSNCFACHKDFNKGMIEDIDIIK
ncbi:cytochrome b/b6 domain-containing protein [Sulfurimonas sp.]|uniref:cytochrome b/b6 domain-containing protein n=1 Tax=Sulfurimonas sp. TaxID=2022749 RepID=UPI002B47F597|nr:cytochrome b/b6 domain-containing protein [Sulfurimonas sp.]